MCVLKFHFSTPDRNPANRGSDNQTFSAAKGTGKFHTLCHPF